MIDYRITLAAKSLWSTIESLVYWTHVPNREKELRQKVDCLVNADFSRYKTVEYCLIVHACAGNDGGALLLV
jgi:hypothetical protein